MRGKEGEKRESDGTNGRGRMIEGGKGCGEERSVVCCVTSPGLLDCASLVFGSLDGNSRFPSNQFVRMCMWQDV